MQNPPEFARPSVRCGSVLITQEADGFSVRCGSNPELVSLGRYPEFRDAVEIPLLLERCDRIRGELTQLQRIGRQFRWDWNAVLASLNGREPSGDVPRVA